MMNQNLQLTIQKCNFNNGQPADPLERVGDRGERTTHALTQVRLQQRQTEVPLRDATSLNRVGVGESHGVGERLVAALDRLLSDLQRDCHI